MSATPNDSNSGAEERQRYFLAIEEVFLRLRGAPLLLSPADWQIATGWREHGIPLELVIEALETLFDDNRQRERPKRISSLRYCGPAVVGLWEERTELGMALSSRPPSSAQQPSATTQPASDPTNTAEAVPVGGETLANRLTQLAETIDGNLAERQYWIDRILRLEGTTEEVEAALEELDAELLAAAEATFDEAQRAELEERLESSVAPWRARLSEPEMEALSTRLRRNLVRDLASLPVLSLFGTLADGSDLA